MYLLQLGIVLQRLIENLCHFARCKPKYSDLQHTYHLTALFPGQSGWAGTRKVKPIWILLKQETVSGSGISWAICKSAPCSRQITTPNPTAQFFLQAGCPSCRPTNSVKALKAKLTCKYFHYFKSNNADKSLCSATYIHWQSGTAYHRCCSNRQISLTCLAHSSKPAADEWATWTCWIDTALYTMQCQ